ncbi:hypothetical protein G6L12_05900 [Agrobacterium rhizogenes]|nr:hypothetical protein [Rhizobium rhizogenes]NTF74008.1 hypothetical protein [Rhizobium rhizogenes]
MTTDTKKFMQFIGAVLGLGLIGGLIVEQNPPRAMAVPFGILWIVVFLGVVGFIVAGKQGTIDLLRATGMMWLFAIIGAIVLWLVVVAGVDHNL